MASACVVTMSEGLQLNEGIEVLSEHVMVLVKQENNVAMEDLGWPTDLHSEALVLESGLFPHEDVNSKIVRFLKGLKILGVHWVRQHSEIDPNIGAFGDEALWGSPACGVAVVCCGPLRVRRVVAIKYPCHDSIPEAHGVPVVNIQDTILIRERRR